MTTRSLPRRLLGHAFMVGGALWAMHVLVTYRVPGRFLFVLLPWIDAALIALGVLYLASDVMALRDRDGMLPRTAATIERGARLLIVVFVYGAFFLFLNARFDRFPRTVHHSEVVEIGARTVSHQLPMVYSWVGLRSWTTPGRTDRLILHPAEQRAFWRGEAVVIQIRAGAFGVPWVYRLDRDEEFYFREVLQAVPMAAGAWTRLTEFLLDNHRWHDAATATWEYLRLYPDDTDAALTVGIATANWGQHADAIPLLEYAVGRRPSRYAYYRLAWALGQHGEATRAIEVLETASARYPDAWEMPHLLAYHSARVGRYAEGAAALERVARLRPDVPDVAEALASLRRRATVSAAAR